MIAHLTNTALSFSLSLSQTQTKGGFLISLFCSIDCKVDADVKATSRIKQVRTQLEDYHRLAHDLHLESARFQRYFRLEWSSLIAGLHFSKHWFYFNFLLQSAEFFSASPVIPTAATSVHHFIQTNGRQPFWLQQLIWSEYSLNYMHEKEVRCWLGNICVVLEVFPCSWWASK